MDDLKCDLSLAVAWAVSTKNALHNVHGFSPNQLVFGKNPNFPAVVRNKPPALEGKTTSEIVACNLNTMHAAHQAFIKSESAERLRRALRHRTHTYSDMKYFTGNIVYYKRNSSNEWKGPGTVIGQDGQQVLVKHGGSYVRVHLCRLLLKQAAFGQPMVDSQDEEEAIRVQQVASQTEKNFESDEDDKVESVNPVNEQEMELENEGLEHLMNQQSNKQTNEDVPDQIGTLSQVGTKKISKGGWTI